ncbi:MAG: serine hydrolase [Bacteroidia bacterium]
MNKPNSKFFSIKTISLTVLCCIALSNISFGQSKADKLDELISRYAEYGQFNGSVLVAEKGKVIYKNGFGMANWEWDIPNQSNTKHRLASVSKQFTAMVIMQLVADGKLALDVPISTYLPDYPKEYGEQITIHHLLAHTSGIPNFTSFPTYRDMERDPISPKGLVDLFADLALEFKPGERFAYSNSGYALLGYIVEQITAQSYEQVLQEKILDPLNMTNTGFNDSRKIVKNRASGYSQDGNDYVKATYIDMSVPFTAGAMYSTVEDLFLWDQALYTEKLIPQKYLDMIFEKHIPSGGSHYGYGWDISEINQGSTSERVATVGHSGGINGFNTLITRIPSDQSSIILLNNTSGAPLNHMTRMIAGILYDKTYDFPQKSVANTIGAVIEKEGISKGLALYEEIKDESIYYLSESEINVLAYGFLQAGKTDEAVSVFKLNVEAFPNAFNVYDSYGEVLLVLGKKEEAIENYKQSILLNPDNQNGLEVLKGLGVDTDDIGIKVPLKQLKLLVGEYKAETESSTAKEWLIKIEEVDGELFGIDNNYRYKLVPQGDNKFINPDDGAMIVFDTKKKRAISFVIFGKYTFNKL